MSDSVKVSDLDRKHPEYKEKVEVWRDIRLLYEGGALLKNNADLLLRQRPREDSDVYQGRKARFTYQNLLATGIGWYSAAMFKNLPEIFFKKNGKSLEGADKEFYTGFLDNCDGNGMSFVSYARKVFLDILRFGSSYTFVDLPRSNGLPPVTLGEQRSRRLLDPLLRLFTPSNLINWKVDDDGAFEWVVLRTLENESQFLAPANVIDTWLYLDRREFKVYSRKRREGDVEVNDFSDEKAELTNSGEHALAHVNRVPLRKMDVLEGLWLANRSYLLLVDHLNQDNTLAWSLFMSNLAVPVIIGDVDTSNMSVSETGFYQFPAGTTYTWSEPEGKSFLHSANRLESLREEAFRDMHLQSQGRSMRATPAMQSGRSKQLEMVPAHDVLCGMGTSLISGMQKLLEDVRDARRDEDILPSVQGLRHEDDMTTEEVFAASSTLNIRVPSKTFERYMYKKVARSWMRNAAPEDMEVVYKEIEDGPTLEERERADIENRMRVAKTGVIDALSRGDSSLKPPGRGGDGPSVNNPGK